MQTNNDPKRTRYHHIQWFNIEILIQLFRYNIVKAVRPTGFAIRHVPGKWLSILIDFRLNNISLTTFISNAIKIPFSPIIIMIPECSEKNFNRDCLYQLHPVYLYRMSVKYVRVNAVFENVLGLKVTFSEPAKAKKRFSEKNFWRRHHKNMLAYIQSHLKSRLTKNDREFVVRHKR